MILKEQCSIIITFDATLYARPCLAHRALHDSLRSAINPYFLQRIRGSLILLAKIPFCEMRLIQEFHVCSCICRGLVNSKREDPMHFTDISEYFLKSWYTNKHRYFPPDTPVSYGEPTPASCWSAKFSDRVLPSTRKAESGRWTTVATVCIFKIRSRPHFTTVLVSDWPALGFFRFRFKKCI